MIRHKIKAFTLVELIVVITILAVLGTIAFVSFQGYAQSSRDSARITDLKSIQKVLALYKIESGFFPDADNAEAVTYLTSPIWSQGTFGENSRAAVKRISDIPVDPLTGTEYAYSTTYSKNEFEVGATFEGEGYAKNNITSLAMAGDRIGTSYVNGEYNGQLIQKEIGGILYVLAVPTIINANMDLSTLTDIVTSGTFAINGGHNLADSYSGTTFNTLGGGNITSVNLANMVVFSGSTTDLTGGDTTGRTTLLTNLQGAYSGTVSITANPSSIGAMMAVDSNNSADVESYASSLVNNSLGANITIALNSGGGGSGWGLVDPNCDKPDVVIGTQTWAGCNSTLGNSPEWGQTDAELGTNNYTATTGCHNYDNVGVICPTNGDILMASNTKANTWFPGVNGNSDSEVNNIWGKLYKHSATVNACGGGYHLPSEAEWVELELTLNAGVDCRFGQTSYRCPGLGWMGHSAKTTSNNIVEALSIPLAGYRPELTNIYTDRGSHGYFWTSTTLGVDAKRVLVSGNNTGFYIDNFPQGHSFGVRCIKD